VNNKQLLTNNELVLNIFLNELPMKKILKFLAFFILLVIVMVLTLIGWGHFQLNAELDITRNQPVLNISRQQASAETGNRIVLIRNGCIHCHGLDLSGQLFIDDLMMGQIGGSNLTPARLKDWTDEEIARAIRYGLNRENKSLRFMPASEFQYLSKSDIASVVAYLRSVAAVEKASPEISIGPMAKILFGIGQLPILASANSLIKSDLDVQKPEEAATVEFGKYLVESACSGCHGMDLQGGAIPGSPPDWPPALPLSGLTASGYTMPGFINAMRSGVRPNGQLLLSPMAESTVRIMSETELEAIWRFLETKK
jgi:mono/diheme cytochrome c family protein